MVLMITTEAISYYVPNTRTFTHYTRAPTKTTAPVVDVPEDAATQHAREQASPARKSFS